LAGLGDEPGACAILPNVSFLPVGPVTDLQEHFYPGRLGLRGGRPEAMHYFGAQIMMFGNHVSELICAPPDIQHFDPEIWIDHQPVTPAVRPKGLSGNVGNNINAFDVEAAVEAGSSALVIASPIMGAENPRKAAELVISQIKNAA
jgi:orotidine-5'-phosphate decarboxylase